MSKKKKQHIVPVSYLKNFSINDQIYFYNTQSNERDKRNPRNIDNIGWRKNLYDFPENLVEKLNQAGFSEINQKYVEDYFAKHIEKEIAPLFKKLSQGLKVRNPQNDFINISDMSLLALYISIQIHRTYLFKELMETVRKTVLDTFTEKKILSKDAELNYYESLEHFSYMINEKRIITIGNLLLNRNWVFLYNNSNIPFVTSDNPVVIDRDDQENLSGYFSKETVIYYPLNSSLVLALYDPKFYQDKTPFNNRLCITPSAIELNILQAEQSEYQLLSPIDEFSYLPKIIKKKSFAENVFSPSPKFKKDIKKIASLLADTIKIK